MKGCGYFQGLMLCFVCVDVFVGLVSAIFSNQEQTCHDLKGKTERDPDNQDGSLDYPDCLASDLVTPVSQPCSVLLDDCAPDIEKCSPDVEKLSDLFPAHDEQSSLSMCSLVQLISGDMCTGNLFSFPGTNPVSVCHSTTSRLITDRDRRGPLKGVGVSGEHSVKGWKTSKRMKNPNQKLRMLSFSDIENCLNTPCSTLSDTTLAEISPDNLLHMRYAVHLRCVYLFGVCTHLVIMPLWSMCSALVSFFCNNFYCSFAIAN